MTKPTQWFSHQEIRALSEPSDLQGALAVAGDWLMVGASMALVAAWPNPFTVVVALLLLAGRQLGFAVLTHEAAHRTLFRTRWLNDTVGHWLCGAPIWLDVKRYRQQHLRHHAYNGGPEDPDLGLLTPYPATPAALRRRLVRDLLGIAGMRRVFGQLAMDLGFMSYTTSPGAEWLPPRPWHERLWLGIRHLGPVLLVNSALLGGLFALGYPALYLLWVASYLTTYSAVLRIRAIAEHACSERGTNGLTNTRTTLVTNPVEQLLFAPHRVNYHVEHHVLMTVPFFRLPLVHSRLREAGALGPQNTSRGYLQVLRLATTAAA